MKIYSVLRSNHLQNNRYVKIFEAGSILEVFQGFADFARQSAEEGDETVNETELYFGVSIYGSYGWIEAVCEGLELNTLADLQASLEEHWYTDEVIAEAGFMQIYTDDDEIDMVWYLFDEHYAAKHPERTILYTEYGDRLPLQADEKPDAEGSFKYEGQQIDIAPAGDGEGRLYMVMVATYDSGVLCDLPGYGQIDGIRLPELENWLRGSQPASEEWEYDAPIRYLSLIAKALPEADLGAILQAFAFKPLSDLSQSISIDDLLQKDWSEIQTLPTRNNTDNTAIYTGGHIAEIQINASSFDHDQYYDYCILFDDIWANAHPVLAENLLRFGTGYEL
ncbi:hypothetical protein [Paenibacillus sp. GCM10027626]|uniref:hypothetical protein n=1 Tax=Paenibacillus sp. GCM10027626 TaxID=3273411 RepID=UPI00362BC6C0